MFYIARSIYLFSFLSNVVPDIGFTFPNTNIFVENEYSFFSSLKRAFSIVNSLSGISTILLEFSVLGGIISYFPVPNFKIASAIIHYDETSPHMHIVGVPIKDKVKNDMSKQVGKSDVFTKESLKKLQDKMRILCIESFNKEYNLQNRLKTKKKGRNFDYLISEMGDYKELKKGIEKNQKALEITNIKSSELDDSSNEIIKVIDSLNTTLTNKDEFILKQDDKDKIIDFLQQVKNTNTEYKKVQELSITFSNVDDELNNNRNKIKTLTENNNALSLRISSLEKKIDNQCDEIYELKEENNFLKSALKYFKTMFNNMVKFLMNRIFRNKDKDKYMDFAKDLYEHGAIDDVSMMKLHDNAKNINITKEKDDYDK